MSTAASRMEVLSDTWSTLDLLSYNKETGDEEARNLLVERYLPLVQAIARKQRARLTPNVDIDDLVSAGVLGLMDAIGGFDGEKGVKFEMYCTIRIRGSMLDELREHDWVPRLVRRRANKIDATRRLLASELQRDATDEEVAVRLDLSLPRFQEMLREVTRPTAIVSLDIVRFDNGNSRTTTKLDLVPDEKSVDPGQEVAMGEVLSAVLRFLDRREKVIMILYYKRGFTMKRIGDVFGMSESRVCQIHTRIMKRLRRRISAGQLGV